MKHFETLESRRLLSLTGWWKLNESSGTAASDSAASNAGVLANGPVWQSAGANAGALLFDGVDDNVQMPASVGSATSFSIAFWMRADALKMQVPVDKMPADASGAGWNIKLRDDGSIWFRVGSNSSFTDTKFSAGYTAGSWVHVTATFSAGTAKLYTNGTLRTTTNAITQTPADTITPVRLGVPSASAITEKFGGMLDDVRIYNHALSQSEVTAIASSNSGLTSLVSALPTSTQQQALKKATLNWALADASASTAAGLTSIATDTYDDVRNLLNANIGFAQTAPSNLFPYITNFSTNPLATSAMSSITTLRNSTTTYTKTNSDYTATVTSQGLEMAWGLMHPQSTLKGDSTLLTGMLRRFQKTYESNLGGVLKGDFTISDDGAEMYLLFKTVYPDLILPSRKVQWEAAIKANADDIDAGDGAKFRAAVPGTSWVNADMRWVAAMRYSYEILGTQRYLDDYNGGMNLVAGSLLPDGAYLYDGMQNDVYTYHGAIIESLGRVWQITGDIRAKNMIVGSYWYYPMSAEPNGTPEYSSGAAWKHYWNQVTGSEAAYIVANVANSPENLRVAQWFTPTPSLFLASQYRPDLTASAAPDNYFAYDRNVMGPRGRFGTFSFVGTATPYTNENRGKGTHIGAMVTDFNGTNNTWRLNAALDSAQSRVRFLPNDDINTMGNDVSFPNAPLVYYEQAVQEKNAYSVSKNVAALSSSYRLSKYKGTVQNWKGEEQWLYTPQRIVGMVSLEALTNQTVYSMLGSLRFVSGRASWGTQKTFTQVDANTWQYGKLLVDIVEQTYGTVTTSYEDTWDATTTVVDNKTGRLNFVETQAAANNEQTLITYPAGTRKYYLVEVRPISTTNPADAVSQIDVGNGLRGIQMKSGNSWYRMISNPTDNALTYSATLPWVGGVKIHYAGEQYRPQFLNAYTTADTDVRARVLSPTVASFSNTTTISVSVPGQQHIVLEPWYGGDANGDMSVNTLDFNILASNFGGSSKAFAQGDFDDTETVNSVDFNILVSNYGRKYTAPAASAPVTTSVLSPTGTLFHTPGELDGNADVLA